MIKKLVLISFLTLFVTLIRAQEPVRDTIAHKDSTFKPSGKLWGYAFGDFYYKAHSDAGNRGVGQYSGIEQGRNAFQFRRIYLGYSYAISPKFQADLLLAAEDNQATSTGATSGDLLADNKLTFYIKYMNVRWKNIWKGTDLVIGEAATPAYPLLIEPIWGYRSIERTLTDFRRLPSYDLGVSLQGKFDPAKGNFGYNLMVANGTSARPENDKFKWFYGDVFAKFLDKKLVFDLYADYQRLNWTPLWHHSRNMVKGFVSYTTPAFTAGVEAFINQGKNDVFGVKGLSKDTLTEVSQAISMFTHFTLIKDRLRFFGRVDLFNPDTKYDATTYTSYIGQTSTYEPNSKELFFTTGFDIMPIKQVHLMPNIWYIRYTSQQPNLTGPAYRDHDLVFRLTFWYTYGQL